MGSRVEQVLPLVQVALRRIVVVFGALRRAISGAATSVGAEPGCADGSESAPTSKHLKHLEGMVVFPQLFTQLRGGSGDIIPPAPIMQPADVVRTMGDMWPLQAGVEAADHHNSPPIVFLDGSHRPTSFDQDSSSPGRGRLGRVRGKEARRGAVGLTSLFLSLPRNVGSLAEVDIPLVTVGACPKDLLILLIAWRLNWRVVWSRSGCCRRTKESLRGRMCTQVEGGLRWRPTADMGPGELKEK